MKRERERTRERERERGKEGEGEKEPPEGIRTMLRRDATSARGARGPRIMYLEQEVGKIRRPVAINNALPTREAASLRPQRRSR